MLKMLLIVFVAMVTGMNTVKATDYRHYDNYALDVKAWELPSSYTFDISNGFLYDSTNERVSVKCCEEKEWAVYLSSPLFNFAVPKKELKSGLEWSFNKELYKVIKVMELSFLGTKTQGVVIQSVRPSGMTVSYFYSQDKGLIGFSFLTSDSPIAEMYWLRESQGIGATK